MKKHPVQNNRIEMALKMMQETRKMRIAWIRDSKPQVPVILEQFPYLGKSKILSNKLNIATTLTDTYLILVDHGQITG